MHSLINRFTFGRPLIGCSLQVVWQHKKLVLFPILIIACTVAVVLFFMAPVAIVAGGQALARPEGLLAMVRPEYWPTAFERIAAVPRFYTYGYAFGLYLVAMFSGTFVTVAFYHEIIRALSGESVSMRRGFAFACSRIQAILLWSLLACTVGLVIRAVADRFGWLAMRFVGIAWSAASIFVIPIMIRDKESNPITLLRNSAAIIKKSWGDAVFGYVGLSAAAVVMVCAWLVLVGVTIFVGVYLGPLAPYVVVAALLGGVFGTMGIFYLSAVAQNIHTCALYVYATEGVVPAPFSARDMDSGWKVK